MSAQGGAKQTNFDDVVVINVLDIDSYFTFALELIDPLGLEVFRCGWVPTGCYHSCYCKCGNRDVPESFLIDSVDNEVLEAVDP